MGLIMDQKWKGLIALGRLLRSEDYRFTAVTPATHRRVLHRLQGPSTLRSVFGWNRPFEREAVPVRILDLLTKAEALDKAGGRYRSKVRYATLGDLLFAHSSFPTTEQNAVFFGPDTYRFARLLRASLADMPVDRPLRLIDVGSGSGAGGIYAARLLVAPIELILSDISPEAVAFSAVNAALNDVPDAHTALSDILAGIEGDADIIISNPPYLLDEERRLYRHGGGELGIELALSIASQSLTRLRPGGRLVLYTGTPIIGGIDPFYESLKPLLQLPGLQFVYEEIDSDVFGEELERQTYAHADRIAAVGLTLIKG